MSLLERLEKSLKRDYQLFRLCIAGLIASIIIVLLGILYLEYGNSMSQLEKITDNYFERNLIPEIIVEKIASDFKRHLDQTLVHINSESRAKLLNLKISIDSLYLEDVRDPGELTLETSSSLYREDLIPALVIFLRNRINGTRPDVYKQLVNSKFETQSQPQKHIYSTLNLSAPITRVSETRNSSNLTKYELSLLISNQFREHVHSICKKVCSDLKDIVSSYHRMLLEYGHQLGQRIEGHHRQWIEIVPLCQDVVDNETNVLSSVTKQLIGVTPLELRSDHIIKADS